MARVGGVIRRANRYLIFYVIVAIGLALSWSKVTQRTQVQSSSTVSLLTIDTDCRPLSAPCAAYAKDFAWVLGPVFDMPSNAAARQLKLVGERLPGGHELQLEQVDAKGKVLSQPTVRQLSDAQQWLIELAPDAARLRVRWLTAQQEWLAAFPLAN